MSCTLYAHHSVRRLVFMRFDWSIIMTRPQYCQIVSCIRHKLFRAFHSFSCRVVSVRRWIIQPECGWKSVTSVWFILNKSRCKQGCFILVEVDCEVTEPTGSHKFTLEPIKTDTADVIIVFAKRIWCKHIDWSPNRLGTQCDQVRNYFDKIAVGISPFFDAFFDALW